MSNEEKNQFEESQEEVCAEYQSFMPNVAPEEVEPVKSELTIN